MLTHARGLQGRTAPRGAPCSARAGTSLALPPQALPSSGTGEPLRDPLCAAALGWGEPAAAQSPDLLQDHQTSDQILCVQEGRTLCSQGLRLMLKPAPGHPGRS